MSSNHIEIDNDNFAQNVVTLNFILVDVSGSMSGEKEKGVKAGLELVKSRLLKLEDTTSTRVAVVEFGSYIRITNLRAIEAFETNYRSKGEMTALYDAIVFVKDEVERLKKKYENKYRLNVNVIVLSDGGNNHGKSTETSARNAVMTLQSRLEAGTLFYAIEDASEMKELTKKAQSLGFTVETLDGTERAIVEASISLSKSLVRSSQNGTPIGSINGANLSGNMSVSGIAEADYKKAMANMQFDDPFEAEFESV